MEVLLEVEGLQNHRRIAVGEAVGRFAIRARLHTGGSFVCPCWWSPLYIVKAAALF